MSKIFLKYSILSLALMLVTLGIDYYLSTDVEGRFFFFEIALVDLFYLFLTLALIQIFRFFIYKKIKISFVIFGGFYTLLCSIGMIFMNLNDGQFLFNVDFFIMFIPSTILFFFIFFNR